MRFDAKTAAEEAYSALRTGRLIAPFSTRGVVPEIGEAYAATAYLRRLRGDQVIGRKIGFTNRDIWPRYGVQAPIWGDVTEATLLSGPVDLSAYAQPRLEPEIVLSLSVAPEPGMDEEALGACIDWVAPGFEIVQSIYPDWQFETADTIIAGGLHGGLFVGDRVKADTALLNGLPATTVSLRRDGAEVETGLGANALDGPLSALQHLNDLLAADPSNPALAAGEIVTTGTLTDAWPLGLGQRWEAVFTGALTGTVSIDCV